MKESADKIRSYPEEVTLILRAQTHQVKPGMDLRSALRRIGIDSEAVLAIRDGKMITDDEILLPGDLIRLEQVISGG